MARLWRVTFADGSEAVEVFAASEFGAAVNARNQTGKIRVPVESIDFLGFTNPFTGETQENWRLATPAYVRNISEKENGNEKAGIHREGRHERPA